MRYAGISPSFSVIKGRGSERLYCACLWNVFLERMTRSVAVLQNGLVDYVAALNTTPGPISSSDWPELHLHAMFIRKYPPAPAARHLGR